MPRPVVLPLAYCAGLVYWGTEPTKFFATCSDIFILIEISIAASSSFVPLIFLDIASFAFEDTSLETGASGDGIITRAAGQMYMTVDDFLRIRDSGSTSENKRFEFQTNTGNAGADANWNSNNFDFAEMFEWSDGNPESEDRIGYSVCVDTLTGKIRKAEEGDTPFGIVSGTASFVANAGGHKWAGYSKRDEWGRILQEPAYDGEGEPLLDDAGNHRTKMAVNPEWDESLVHDYVPRSERPEWACIGVMGQVYMRKGCPVDSRWVKLKEIDSVKDLWLVR